VNLLSREREADDVMEEWPDDIVDAVTALYRDPPEEFVKQRDELVAELRRSGRRQDAATVKRLRRPGRPAWALDTVFFTDPPALERVAAAVAGVVEAQQGQGDLREATRLLRAAVRDAADVASLTAGAGLASERASLVRALTAVVGDPDAFALLRAGRLNEIPTGASVDALMRPPAVEVAPLQPIPDRRRRKRAASETKVTQRAEHDVEQAEAAVADAKSDAALTETEVEAASTSVDAANVALRQAEVRLRDERARLQEARRQAKLARDRLRDAERALAVARGRRTRLGTTR
jgi:hypothetical protein